MRNITARHRANQ